MAGLLALPVRQATCVHCVTADAASIAGEAGLCAHRSRQMHTAPY
jgi:hypothetical protein